jgi:multidrug resistance efflux pump
MNDADGDSASEQSWNQLYEAALLELDPSVLPQRIADAQKAIGERALALLRKNGHNHSEKAALASAHALLEDLKRIQRTAERTPPGMQMGGRHERIGEKGLA